MYPRASSSTPARAASNRSVLGVRPAATRMSEASSVLSVAPERTRSATPLPECPVTLSTSDCKRTSTPSSVSNPRSASATDRKSTRLNSSHLGISYAVFSFTATASIYSLSLHDALPISVGVGRTAGRDQNVGGFECPLRRPRAHPECYPFARMPRDAEHLRLQEDFDAVVGQQPPQRVGHRSEEHTSELQSLRHLVCRLLLHSHRLDILSFPTRRSSDLGRCWAYGRPRPECRRLRVSSPSPPSAPGVLPLCPNAP